MAQLTTDSGTQISYDDGKLPLMQDCIEALIGSLTEPRSLEVGFQVSRPLHLLGELIRIKSLQEAEFARHVIFKAAISCQGSPQIAVIDFLDHVGRVASEHTAAKSTSEYMVLLPLNVEPSSLEGIQRFNLNGVILERTDWADLRSRYAVDDGALRTKIGEYMGVEIDNPWNSRATPLIAKIYARDSAMAFNRVFEQYEILCAMMNFYYLNHYVFRNHCH